MGLSERYIFEPVIVVFLLDSLSYCKLHCKLYYYILYYIHSTLKSLSLGAVHKWYWKLSILDFCLNWNHKFVSCPIFCVSTSKGSGSKEEKNSLRDANLCNRKPRHASSFSLECTDFKNVIFEKIHWAPSEVAEVAEVKRPRNSK